MPILDASSSWRCHFLWMPPVYGTVADARPAEKETDFQATPPPAANWTQPDFDEARSHVSRESISFPE